MGVSVFHYKFVTIPEQLKRVFARITEASLFVGKREPKKKPTEIPGVTLSSTTMITRRISPLPSATNCGSLALKSSALPLFILTLHRIHSLAPELR
jgi:hypothetical protein